MLELLDGRRQRGLRDEQPLCGTPIVQFLAEDGEVPELPQRDVRARGCSPSWFSARPCTCADRIEVFVGGCAARPISPSAAPAAADRYHERPFSVRQPTALRSGVSSAIVVNNSHSAMAVGTAIQPEWWDIVANTAER
jgi:hypothetical protein